MKKILLFVAALACSVASWAQNEVSATATSGKLSVALTNESEAFVAFQMDIVLPADVTVANDGTAVTFNDQRLTQPGTNVSIAGSNETANFQVVYNVLSDGKVRVIAYNLENRALAGHAGELFSVAFTGSTSESFTVENIKFVTESALEEIKLTTVTSVPGSSYRMGDIVGEDDSIDVFDLNALVDIMAGNIQSSYRLEQANPVQAAGQPVEYDVFDLNALIDLMAHE